MANRSNERDIIVSLVAQASQDPELRGQARFDPKGITQIDSTQGVEGLQTVFLRRTSSLHVPATYTELDERPGRPPERARNIGYKTVALYAGEGPALSKANSDDIIHPEADLGVWLRRPTDQELEVAAEGLDARRAWVFEVAVPLPGMSYALNATGVISEPYVPTPL